MPPKLKHHPRPHLTPELLAAVAAYQAAHAYTESIRPTIEGYQLETVLAQKLRYADHYAEDLGSGKIGPITTIDDIWMMDDAQSEAFFAALHAAHLAHGFQVDEVGKCPLLIAENMESKAERVMIDAAAYITHITAHDAMLDFFGVYKKMTPLILGLVAAVQQDEQRARAA